MKELACNCSLADRTQTAEMLLSGRWGFGGDCKSSVGSPSVVLWNCCWATATSEFGNHRLQLVFEGQPRKLQNTLRLNERRMRVNGDMVVTSSLNSKLEQSGASPQARILVTKEGDGQVCTGFKLSPRECFFA